MKYIFLFLFLFCFACGEETKLFVVPDLDSGMMMVDASIVLPEPHEPDAGTIIVDAGDPDPLVVPFEHGLNVFAVRLFWDIHEPQRGSDVDLHLLHPQGLFWSSEPYDCFYLDPQPEWDRSSTTSPTLDHDIINGHGPETIKLYSFSTHEVDKPYRIGVHYFSSHFTGPSEVYVQAWCSGIVVQFGPVVLVDNQIWRVADVFWDGILCSIVPIKNQDGSLNISFSRER